MPQASASSSALRYRTRSGTGICQTRGPAQCTGTGCTAPEQGHRFNANKLLLDPYAKALVGEVRWSDELFGYTLGSDNTGGQHWKRLVDTNQPDQRDEPLFTPGDTYQVTGRSLFVFVLQKHN
jgi:hypothetical protein